ncbi:hypothetical protein Pan153_07890 [Gimesia panareensis]|uniref:Cytochrome C n=1 Tax=Gimesia panareensis TaxID=2527978 RepID=A0A518FIJ7_9PLAN|nr:cytochrome c [Gimesia panareensis]QDV16168.1 hypothetical protein Pan153_07890 [Gimesia panareensis]
MNKPTRHWYRRPIRCFALTAGACLTVSLFTGCGGSSTPAPAPAQQQTQAPAAQATPQVAQTTPTQSQPKPAPAEKEGRKMIDGIPYDVWFDNPLAVAGDNQSVQPVALPGTNVAANSTTPAPAGEMKAAPTQASAGGSGGPDWKTIIPMPILEAQVKDIRNRLTKNMQSVGTYNTSYLELPTFTATLAALAEIANEHPDDIGWKKNAKYLRDLSAKFTAEPLTRGAKSYRALQIPYEQMIVIMNGSAPAGLPESDDKKPIAEVASMGDLMKRADISYKWLKSNVGSADALKAEKEKVIEEAHLLAAISKIITLEGYGYVDDKGFLGYANPMQEACLKMVEAAKNDNFPEFDQGMSRVYKSCTECHSEYKE